MDSKVYKNPIGRRVVLKFRDYVELPYQDGAEEHLLRIGIGPWEALSEAFPGIALKRLFASIDEEKILELVSRAQEIDHCYQPPNLLAYFAIECPLQVDPSALAKALLAWEAVETTYVESPPMPPPAVNPNDDPRYKNQGHLKSAPDGIDAAYAWQFTGGDGTGIKFVDIESGWMILHEDLGSAGVQQIYGVNKSGAGYMDHGTAVLGVVIGADNAKGGIGIAPNAQALVASEWENTSKVNRPDALLKAIASLGFGDVLLLEMQATNKLPVETEVGIFDLVRLATALGIVIIEPAGNGGQDLGQHKNLAGKAVLNRTSPDFKDSGAILVAAAVATAPHHRAKFSNYGNRVDCYSWGESVDTCWCDAIGAKSDYTVNFAGTSSASAIIAGVALCVQGIAAEKLKYRLSAWQMRKLLGDTAVGTPGELPPEAMIGDPGIGVMPDLKALLSKGLNFAPDVYLRDFVGDKGDPHQGSVNASPDIILRTSKVIDPKAAFGEGSGTENSNTLGDKAIHNQDNYIYARLHNRGAADAKDVEVEVFYAPVATLVTPLLWKLVGSVKGLNVPGGNTLTVSDAITWKNVPNPGHYCFVGIVGSPLDPAPAIADFLDWNKFLRIVRENNNVTWRNFQVEPNVPKPPSPFCELPFMVSGAPDIGRKMSLAVGMRFPEGAEAWLEAPDYLVDAMGMNSPGVRPLQGQDTSWVPLNPYQRTVFSEALMPAGTVHQFKLMVHIPGRLRENAYEVYVSQLFQGDEVGRVTWRLAPSR